MTGTGRLVYGIVFLCLVNLWHSIFYIRKYCVIISGIKSTRRNYNGYC